MLLLLILPSPVFAAGACTPLLPGGGAAGFSCLEDIFKNILGIAIAGASLGFFIMILSGGIKWLTSSGDPKDIENARGRITFAALGLFLIIFAWFILRVISEVTGITDILNFTIPQ